MRVARVSGPEPFVFTGGQASVQRTGPTLQQLVPRHPHRSSPEPSCWEEAPEPSPVWGAGRGASGGHSVGAAFSGPSHGRAEGSFLEATCLFGTRGQSWRAFRRLLEAFHGELQVSVGRPGPLGS